MERRAMLCFICGKPATYTIPRPGSIGACDDHIEMVAAYNALEERVGSILYERSMQKEINFEDLKKRKEALYQQMLMLRPPNYP